MPPVPHTDQRHFISSSVHLPLGRSWASTLGRFTSSCSISLKITLHEAEARERKFNYDTKARRCPSLIVLLGLPVPSAGNLPIQRKVKECIDSHVLNNAARQCPAFVFKAVLLRTFTYKLKYLIIIISNSDHQSSTSLKGTVDKDPETHTHSHLYIYTVSSVNTAGVCPLQQQQVVWAAQYVCIDFGWEFPPKTNHYWKW